MLTENPVWMSELIEIGLGKYTFVNPPLPAIIATPFVWIFKEGFQQQFLAHILGALSVLVVAKITQKISNNIGLIIWSSLLFGLGTIIWFLSSNGSVWYLGQITGVFFMLLSLNEYLGKRRIFWISLFLSLAFFSRLQLILSLPFFVFLIFKNNLSFKKVFLFIIPITLFVGMYFTYNYLRFGNVLQNGYTLIPGILEEPWFNKGQFSFYYVPNHLNLLFLKLPIFSNTFPFIKPSWAGLAIWITTPAFIYAFRTSLKDKVNIFSWISIFFIGLLNACYGSTGFSQFGYRYAVDFYPFLILLTVKGVSGNKLKWHHWLLLSISILVNFWGVIWINKFGWVNY